MSARAERARQESDGDEQETQLEQHECEQRQGPPRWPALTQASHRFDQKERCRHFGPDSRGVENDRRTEGDERKESAGGGVVDTLVLEETHGGARQQRSEDRDRGDGPTQPTQQVAGDQQQRKKRLMPRVQLAARADRIAELRRQIGASGRRVREIAVLVRQV